MMRHRPTRRQFLGAAGVIAVTALAWCDAPGSGQTDLLRMLALVPHTPDR